MDYAEIPMDFTGLAGRRLILWQRGGLRIEFDAVEDGAGYSTRLEPELHLGDLVQPKHSFVLCQISDLQRDKHGQRFTLRHVCCYTGTPQ